MLVAIEMGLEPNAVFIHVSQTLLARSNCIIGAGLVNRFHVDDLLESRTQAHDLESAGIGEGRAPPAHELAQATSLIEDIGAWLKVQVISIGKYRLGTELLYLHWGDSLHRCFGANGDERRSLDLSVRSSDNASAS